MSEPGYNIFLRSSARTNVGQVRQNNEDNIHLWLGEQTVLAVVADGMGGAAAGEEASRLAVEAVQSGMALSDTASGEVLNKIADDRLNDQLRDSILQANMSIIQRATEAPEMRGMGTTITLAFVRGKDVTVAHVGDSRAYLVSAGNSQIKQITSDHSFVEALFAAGHITREQADEHPMRNVLYRALGQTEDVDVDLYHSYLQIGDRLVLCSDGLTRHVKPEEIAEIALAETNPDTASQRLIDLANSRGGEDNVSVIVISVEQGGDNHKRATQMNRTLDPSETNEEDTLVFKERPDILKDAAQKYKDKKSTSELAVHSDDGYVSPEDRSFNRDKMNAERMSDQRNGDDTLPEEAPGAETIPEKHNLDPLMPRTPDTLNFLAYPRPITYQSHPLIKGGPRDEDGEARDTFTPRT